MNDSNEGLKKQLKVVKKQLAESEKNVLIGDQNIQKAHQEWMAALDMLEDLIFMYDENFRILRCNHAYQLQAALPYSKIIGHPYYEIFPKTDSPLHSYLPKMQKDAKKGNEKILQIGDSDYLSRVYVIRDNNQDYLYSVHILEDVTDQIKIKNALQTSQAQYRRLFESAKDGILILDGDTGIIVDANPFILKLTAYTLNEISGKKLWEIGLISDIAQSKISFEELQENDYIRYEDLSIKTKDGQAVDVEFVSSAYLVDSRRVIQCNIRDIGERMRIQKALQTSQAQYRRLFEGAKDGILILDGDTGIIVDANPFILKLTAYTLKEISGKKLWEIGLISDIAQSKISFEELQENDYIRYENLPIKTKDGQAVDVEFVSSAYYVSGQRVIQCNIHDITERIKSEQLLQESEEKFYSITRTAQDAIIIISDEGNITYWNEAATQIFGYTKDEAIGKALHPLLAPERFLEAHRKGFEHFVKTGEGPDIGKTIELSALKKDGTEFPIELSLSANMREGRWEAIGIVRDISKRKKDEAGLKMFRTLLDHSNDAIEVLDAETLQYIDVNETSCRTLGYSRDELLSMNVRDIDSGLSESKKKKLMEELKNEGSLVFESTHRRKDGSIFPVEISISIQQSDKEYAIAVVRDITQRKQTEDMIRRTNRALKTLSAGNMALVQAKSEDELLKRVTEVIVKEGGYKFAVVNYANDDPQKTIIPMAWSGLEGEECPCHQNANYLLSGACSGGEGEYRLIKGLSWSETAENQMPVSKAIRTATTQVTRDIAQESEFKLWRDAALGWNFTSSIALPLKDGSKVFGALNIYTSEANAFAEEKEEEEEVLLLEELANDLAYGIITLRTRIAHEQQAKILQESLEQSIQTIAATVESRDPYTAGHQQHVDELATAIAMEMGLDEDQVNGIHLAAIIHDLGKIHIPAEILSKPGKLSSIEFMLIQTHPQEGYDILKDVKFPWPIADIILQHHERLDGSGYPQGLKGDQILLEAKIIAVADVVEAISSHRPYRAALGIKSALEEIKQNRGTLYEASVVDACLKLFKKKKFTFSS